MDEFVFYEKMATITLTYDEIEHIVAFVKKFEREDIPETMREEILPKLEDFLVDNL